MSEKFFNSLVWLRHHFGEAVSALLSAHTLEILFDAFGLTRIEHRAAIGHAFDMSHGIEPNCEAADDIQQQDCHDCLTKPTCLNAMPAEGSFEC